MQGDAARSGKEDAGVPLRPGVGAAFKGWLLHTTQWKISAQFKRRRRERREVHLTEESGTSHPRPGARRPTDFTRLGPGLGSGVGAEPAGSGAGEGETPRQSGAVRDLLPARYSKERPVKEVAATLEVSAARVYLARHRVGRLLKARVPAPSAERQLKERSGVFAPGIRQICSSRMLLRHLFIAVLRVGDELLAFGVHHQVEVFEGNLSEQVGYVVVHLHDFKGAISGPSDPGARRNRRRAGATHVGRLGSLHPRP